MSRWALAAAEGDQVALRRFVATAQPDLWQFCAYLGSPQDADDLVQETLLRAIRSLRSYRADAPAMRWLLGIARRVCADDIRAKQRRRRLLGALSGARAATVDSAGQVDLEALIQQLDEDRRVAFVLTQVLGYSYDEAAAVCGCPIGTIRSRVARGRAQLLAEVRSAAR